MCDSVEEAGLTCGLDERLEAAEDKTKHFKLSVHLCLHTFTLNHQPVGVIYTSMRTRCLGAVQQPERDDAEATVRLEWIFI